MSIFKFKFSDLKYFSEYFAPVLKSFKPKQKIKNIHDLKDFIQKKSAWTTQTTLYGYLKTRMGAKYVLMFSDEIFLTSVNKAKWNIYVDALQDLNLYCLSYLKANQIFDGTSRAQEILNEILEEELKNELPIEVKERAEKSFIEKLQKINWETHFKNLPFNDSALSLYHWSPIAEELKTLDRKIVLNSMILKWDNIKKEFEGLINF